MSVATAARSTDLFASILAGQPTEELESQFPFYPLNSPGMPLPGPNFVAHAVALGDAAPALDGKGADKRMVTYGKYLDYLYRRALYDERFCLPVFLKGRQISVSFVPGHLWGESTQDLAGGPRPAKVMVIGKHPGHEEVAHRRNFIGTTSDEFPKALQEIGVPSEATMGWYLTNLCKFPNPDRNSQGLAQAFVKDCALLLAEELRLVRPDYILCLGSDASKALLGTPYSVEAMVGRVVNYSFAVHDAGDPEQFHTAKVMTALHPAAVARTPELQDPFSNQLSKFWQLSNGYEVGAEETDVEHLVVYKEEELARIVDAAIADQTPFANVISVDGEWHGDYPTEPGAYLRTIQFSNKDKWACTVVLRHQGGAQAFKPGPERAIFHLNRLLKRPGLRIGGHFFRADLPWLKHSGLDLLNEYAPHPDVNVRDQGGWDTSLAYHAYNETAKFKLEDMSTRLLPSVPRYDIQLQEWKKDYCHRHKIKAEALEGYGECPAHVLYPDKRLGQYNPCYAGYDADATRRSMLRLLGPSGLVYRDSYGNDAYKAYWTSHMASLAFLNMEMVGFMVDRDRADALALNFMTAREAILTDLRQEINWPQFNPKSSQQCVALLFGDQFAGKRDKVTKQLVAVRPEGAVTLGLTPVKTTGKRGKNWADIVARHETDQNSPSTDKETLGILGYINPIAAKLRDLKFIGQVLTSVLRVPEQDDESGEFVEDENGNYVYDKGLLGSVHVDGRVRTHLQQVKETGRASSSRPPLQNLSSRREDDYKRVLGSLDDEGKPVGTYKHLYMPMYNHPIRSVLRVPPGYVGLEADIAGAELAILAWAAQDHQMIDHVLRSNLPENDPDHYDIHSRTACKAFQLTCAPTKTGMRKSGKKGLRVAAKNIVFGSNYDRSAAAIARQCAEEGVDVTVAECEALQQAYFDTYPQVEDYKAECRKRSQSPGWLMNFFGRLRRFRPATDKQVIGEQQRQALNFPIQSGVADAISLALANMLRYRSQFDPQELWFDIMLQIHDSIVLLVPVQHAARVYEDVFQRCMIDELPIMPTRLDGSPIQGLTQPYRFGMERGAFLNWGESIPRDYIEHYKLPDWMGQAA